MIAEKDSLFERENMNCFLLFLFLLHSDEWSLSFDKSFF